MARPHPVQWLRSHPVAADWMLAGLLLFMGLGSHLTVEMEDAADPKWFSVVLTVVATVPAAWRRRSPIPALVVMMVAQMLLEIGNFEGAGWSGVIVGTYSLGAYVRGRKQLLTAGLCLAAALVLIIIGLFTGDAPWQALIATPVSFCGALVLGDNVRRRRERAAELVERAERAERERELLALQALQDERTRIARELHDVVAHSVSLMVIQAGAARRQLGKDPAKADNALATVETTGRQAMTEMRRILGVLRDGGQEAGPDGDVARAPQPSLSGLQALADAATDMPVAVHIEGDLRGLPAGVELNAYRIVQEALTNVRRHAGPVAKVDVTVRRQPAALTVEVADDGRGASADHGVAAGFGLAGMRERVAAYEGDLVAGPRVGGGWRVRATFPVVAA